MGKMMIPFRLSLKMTKNSRKILDKFSANFQQILKGAEMEGKEQRVVEALKAASELMDSTIDFLDDSWYTITTAQKSIIAARTDRERQKAILRMKSEPNIAAKFKNVKISLDCIVKILDDAQNILASEL